MKVLLVFGTRPEAIKMIPVAQALSRTPGVDLKVCVTGQHREMLDQVLDLFSITPDYDLDIMRTGARGLTASTAGMLQALEPVFAAERPDRILVHGDTATTLAASLAAYYQKIPVGHVEAGLRSSDIYQPWPEEVNRRVTDVIADQFYAPTLAARDNLLRENVPADRIFVTGNTVIDALFETVSLIDRDKELRASLDERFKFINPSKRLLVITGHRRENFGPSFASICHAIADIVEENDLEAVYPVHLNPEVQRPVRAILGNKPGIHLIEPLDYLPFVELMRRAHIIMTDSGGIQEEAPSLGKPVFVMRNVTERPEAIEAGTACLVGTDRASIVATVSNVLQNETAYRLMSGRRNPYGDGKAAKRIARIISGHKEDIAQHEAFVEA